MSVRLHLVVEGWTEKRFVDGVLAEHLAQHGVFADARCVLTSRDGARWRRGGLGDYKKPKCDLILWMKQEARNRDVRFSTMFDLYALPDEFPGYTEARVCRDPYDRVRRIEAAMARDIDHPGFIPYIQLHEFEALILVDPGKLGLEFLGRERAIENLIAASQGQQPEMIDDGHESAPSKRIIKEIPEYAYMKGSVGPTVVKHIGLSVLRGACPHFDEWIAALESLGTSAS